jgi:hypothetical protein
MIADALTALRSSCEASGRALEGMIAQAYPCVSPGALRRRLSSIRRSGFASIYPVIDWCPWWY